MPVDEPLYPINLRLKGARCLVVGGGRVAEGKVLGLLEAGAVVTVVAPEIAEEIASLADVRLERRAYQLGDLAGYRLAIAATGDPEVNRAVFLEGEATGVWVNAADDPDNCTFTLPARIRRGPLLVTFATGGNSPALASWLRRRYTDEFGPEYEVLIELLAEARRTAGTRDVNRGARLATRSGFGNAGPDPRG